MRRKCNSIVSLLLMGMISISMLAGCQSSDSKTGDGQIDSSVTGTLAVGTTSNDALTLAQTSADSVKNSSSPYDDTDSTVPDGYDEKKTGVDYGTVNDRVSYYSSTAKREKMCGVFLPAGYSTDVKYPVVYVLHGFWGDHFDWSREESWLQTLYGNMLADGTAKPMIMIAVDMNSSESVPADDDGTLTRQAYDNFQYDLEKDLMPFIEKNYPVATGRDNTAIIGVSQGATESLGIGFILQDKIGYIGAMAPCTGVIPTPYYKSSFWNIPMIEAFSIKKDEYMPNYILMMVGNKDPWCIESTVYYDEDMTQKGIPHQYYYLEDVGHGDDMWKPGFYNFFKRIF